MTRGPSEPVVLTTVPNEAEAAIIVAILEDAGITARSIGELTSQLRAEVPGVVKILVPADQLAAAHAALAAAHDAPSAEELDRLAEESPPDPGV